MYCKPDRPRHDTLLSYRSLKQEKLSIAVVARWFPSVSQTFVMDHVSGLVERGHRVEVFSRGSTQAGSKHGDYDRYGLPERTTYWTKPELDRRQKLLTVLHGIRSSGPGAAGAAWAASRAYAGTGLDRWSFITRTAQLNGQLPGAQIVHAHFGPEGEEMAALKACGALKQPLVVSMHGFDLTRLPSQKKSPYPNLFLQASRIVVTTDFMAEKAMALGCPPERIRKIPIGIRLERFPFLERRWSQGEPLRVLSISRMVEKKGLQYSLAALGRAARAGIEVEYTVIGDGPLRAKLTESAQQLGLGSKVRFLGAQGRELILAELSQCHLFVLPSVTAEDGDAEGQGMVLQEAQACGIPCVVTRHGGLPEGCLENLSAVLVPERDSDALATAILHLQEQNQAWPAMGRAGRQLAEDRYSLTRHLDALEEVYASLI